MVKQRVWGGERDRSWEKKSRKIENQRQHWYMYDTGMVLCPIPICMALDCFATEKGHTLDVFDIRILAHPKVNCIDTIYFLY